MLRERRFGRVARRGWLAAGLVAVAFAARAAAPATVTSTELAPLADGARFTVDLSAAVGTEIFTLAHPDRVVIDLTPARAAGTALRLPPAQGLVRGVRSGPRDGGVLRIVLDVAEPVSARSGPLVPGPAGRRLVLDIHPLAAKVTALPAATPASTAPTAAPPPVPTMAAAAAPAAADVPPAPVPAPPPAARLAHVAAPTPRAVAPLPVDRTPTRPVRDLVIAVDAGHGGDDPGASGRDGTHEKDVTLAVARVLARRINAEPGMRAVLTRSTDVFVPLRERIRLARVAQADLFVSVHADAVLDRSVSGSSVYVLSQRGATNEAAKWLADRENAADLVGGVSLDDKDNVLASVLLDLSQSAAMSASMNAAEKVLDELNRIGDVRKERVQQAGFVVLKSPDIPSMLIESAYITNPAEERRLRDPHYQLVLADAILAGLRNYFHDNPPPGTRLAALAAANAPAGGYDPGRALAH
jgi:N-acetylmuramoyl-L-alanine amidase